MKVSVRVTPDLEELIRSTYRDLPPRGFGPGKTLTYPSPGVIIGEAALTAHRKGLSVSGAAGVIRSEKDLEEAFWRYRDGCDASRQVRCSAGVADIVDSVGVYEVKLGPSRSELLRAIDQVLRYRDAMEGKHAYIVAESFPMTVPELRVLAKERGVSFLVFNGYRVVEYVLAMDACKFDADWWSQSLFSALDNSPMEGVPPPTHTDNVSRKVTVPVSVRSAELLKKLGGGPDVLMEALERGLRAMV